MTLFTSFKKRFFRITALFMVMLLSVSPLAWLSISHPQQLQGINSIIAHNSVWFTSFRWLVIIGLFISWPKLILHGAMHYDWSIEKAEFWFKQRFKVFFWLVLFELVLGENLLLMTVHAIESVLK